jgi:hypothetical protein
VKLSLHPHGPLRIFGISGIITAVSLLAVGIFLGLSALWIAIILIAVELAFSFDNAVINAKVLARMSPFWQQMFLTVGVVLAIFGMRIIFPMLIVMVTAHLPLGTVINLAFHHPEEYAHHLELAHPAISAFGGSFLLMLALHFFMDDEKKVHWIHSIERPMRAAARWWLPGLMTIAIIGIFASVVSEHRTVIWQAGLAGVGLFLAINIFTEWIGGIAGNKTGEGHKGIIALLMFGYLQVLDASFSFDSVIGAFAITNDVILIAVGLGVGAIWVRSLTVFMVRRRMLEAFVYLEHGAHYAVLSLAAAMLISLIIDVPQFITGLVGIGVIASSIVASRQLRQSKKTA